MLGLLAFLLPMAWHRRSRVTPWFLALGVVAGFGAMGALLFGHVVADARFSKQPIDLLDYPCLGSQLLEAESALGPLLLGVACAWTLWRGRRTWLGHAPAVDVAPPAAARIRALCGAWAGATWALCAWRLLAVVAIRFEPYEQSWPVTLVATTLLHVLAAALAGLALWHRRWDAARAAEFVAWGTAAQVVSLAAAATGLVGPWRWWSWWHSAAAIWSHLAPAVLVAGLGAWAARLGRQGCRSRSLHGIPVR